MSVNKSAAAKRDSGRISVRAGDYRRFAANLILISDTALNFKANS
jgi:hypothetical protein